MMGLTRQRVCEDTSDPKDLDCAVVTCRFRRVIEVSYLFVVESNKHPVNSVISLSPVCSH